MSRERLVMLEAVGADAFGLSRTPRPPAADVRLVHLAHVPATPR
ncbi:hypothetical protein [Streptomyces sp. NPDC059009]